jgi:transglutaminase-like putative cysteine protease/lipoprotein NlpI
MSSKFWPAFLLLTLFLGPAVAQTPPARPVAAKAASPYPTVPAGSGYRFGPAPGGVTPLPAAGAAADQPAAPGAKARREPLVDIQVQLAARSATASYMHLQRVALDSSTLREVSEPQISFNPAYQQLVIHQLGVIRDGRREDRLKDARIELMRREQMLERQMIDGVRTALVVISDVRVGDVVDLAYTVAGENPIFEGRYAALLHVASDAPIDRLHLRIEGPPQRKLQVKGIATDLVPERFEEGGRQVLRLVREHVAPIVDEDATPPWFKVYPALHVSEYAGWGEVDRWAQGLFAPEPLQPALAERVAVIKAEGGAPEQQVAAALRFVQDEVRYFSVSLGESSHRPKAPSRTLAERLGDCKDKVMLLDALLAGLGVEARPTLVSMQRNRGLVNFLPSHDAFDHVISRVQLGEQVYFLDPTINGQGLTLDKRGYYPYGAGLVVGGGNEGPVAIAPPAFAVDALSYRQDWDLSDLKRPARLATSFKASGLAAERWRALFAQAGTDRLAEAIGGHYVRAMPGLVSAGSPVLADDRTANEIELRLAFEHPAPGSYARGTLELELPAIELGDALALPPEARRRYPFMLDGPRRMELRIAVTGPQPFKAAPPAPQQVGDRHFSFQSRVENQGGALVAISRYERRGDEVLPADLDGYRERVGRARQLAGSRARLALLDFRDKSLEPEFAAIDLRLAKYRGTRPDALLQILQASEITRLVGLQLLPRLEPGSRLAARVLAERAQAGNTLGDFAGALHDADLALQGNPPPEEAAAALEARGVALVGLARPAEALAAFSSQAQLGSSNAPGAWLGTTHYMLGDYAQAEVALRDNAANVSGEARHFTLLWLYLAAERQGGRGQAAIADEVAGVDSAREEWGGVLLRYLGGALDRDALLKAARAKPEQERLRLAEAYFFIGQQLAAQGRRGEALPWFERTVSTQAVPYREVTLAQWELKRGVNERP